jgi:hypothetical protein
LKIQKLWFLDEKNQLEERYAFIIGFYNKLKVSIIWDIYYADILCWKKEINENHHNYCQILGMGVRSSNHRYFFIKGFIFIDT